MASDELKLLNLLPELLSRVANFLPGKAISTFALTVAACNEFESSDIVLRQMVLIAGKRCTAFLEDAPTSLRDCWRILSTDLLADENEPLNMRQLSEWCAVLDYCEQCPRILSEFYQEEFNDNVTPEQKCWVVGGGNVTPRFDERMDPDGPPQTSQAVFTSHQWTPQLLCVAEQWFAPNVEFSSGFPVDFGWLEENISQGSLGLLSWRDGNALGSANRQTDLQAGFIASQQIRRPFSELVWLLRATCQLYRFIHTRMNEEGLSWLSWIATFDNHMLCTWVIDEEANEATPAEFVQDGSFVDKVFKLLQIMDDLW